MSEEIKSELLKLIEKLTTSGKKTLEEGLIKKLKNICKSSNEYLNYAYYGLMTQLRKNHSEIRYSTLLIMNELFCRSHIFRKLLEIDMDEFLELVVETNPERPLPLPKVRAKELKLKGLELMKAWASKSGVEYIRFKMALKFLEGCKKVDFNDMEARSIAERERQQREEERLERVIKEKVDRVKKEIQETRNEIYDLLTQMENCFRLIIPHPEEELFSSTDFEKKEIDSPLDEAKSNCEKTENTLRHHGIYDMKKGITIEVNRSSEVAVNINEDNQPLIENINDLHKQMSSRYYPMVTRWLKILSKGRDCTDALKQSIDLKQQIDSAFAKFKDLKINTEDLNSEEDEDDFIEVEEKDGYEDKPFTEPRVPNILSQPSCSKELSAAEKAHLWKLKHSEDDVKDPTSAASTLSKRIKSHAPQISSTSCSSSSIPKAEVKNNKSELLAKAPVLPYDIDLYHWEDEKPIIPEVVKFDSLHKFWESKDDDDGDNETLKAVQIASLRTRKIDFSGKFEPVKWFCRAPLPSGKLCPRKDRVKCPFHGKIIRRDSTGKPVDSTEDPTSSSSSSQATAAVPDWQDPALLRDIEAATGIDLKIKEKRGKGSKGKNKKMKNGLTNINVPQTSARDRLNKKIMKRYKHYAKKLDDAEKKLFNDKFGDQWNYY